MTQQNNQQSEQYNENNEYFATCPKQLEELLQSELQSLGCDGLRQTVAGVYFQADIKQVYSVCLWSRLANRILMPLARAKIETIENLYELVFNQAWENLFTAKQNFIVDFIGTNDLIRNSQFGAQKIKDAIVDRFLEKTGQRPSVDKASPDVRINARLSQSQVILSIDISGESLHRRAYRGGQGAAPLKENLAAAILLRSGWLQCVETARANNHPAVLIDPMCGSGTFLIEAALLAKNMAPGSRRDQFGFEKLLTFNAEIWNTVKRDAAQQVRDDVELRLLGYDADRRVLNYAKENSAAAGVENLVQVECQSLQQFTLPESVKNLPGLMLCNPPYGERLGEIEALRSDYRMLGQIAKQELTGWQLAVFTSNADLGREMRLRPKNRYKFFNGTIPAELLLFDIVGGEAKLREDFDLRSTPLNEGAQMLANRLLKNKRKLEPWLARENISCYRLYDADMPEYSAAIDVYGSAFHIQEYRAPKTIDEASATRRFNEIIHACVHTFQLDPDNVYSKTRMRQKGKSQYEKQGESAHNKMMEVKEGSARLLVNLQDYLDTGLFLDHRPLRRMLHEQAMGKSFLNLFCYTATATVQAALGGAKSSISVDMSNTYLEWAKDNFELNNISTKRHRLFRQDVVAWLTQCREGFDLIMLDPPSFSNSKNTATVLDIQRDHVSLITRCMDILNPGGILYFSNNLQSFKLDADALAKYRVENITEASLDPDFERNKKIHTCWKITAK